MSQQLENGEDGEEQPAVQPVYPSQGPDRDEMAAEYLPEGEDWLAKTVLDLNDPQAAAALSQFGQLFPEVRDLQDPIDEFTTEFFKGRTAVSGQSRDEYNRIIESMFGGNMSEETKRWAAMFGAGDDDD